MSLADRIKEAMGDMSPADLARATQVTPASVTFWLDGTTKSLRAEKAALIEQATGYRASWIVTGKGPKRVDEPDSDLESAFAKLVSQRGVEVERPAPDQIPRWLSYHAGRRYTPDFVLTAGDKKLFVEVKGDMESEHAQELLGIAAQYPHTFALFAPNYSAPNLGVDEFLAHSGLIIVPGNHDTFAAKEPRAAYGMTTILAWEHQDDLPDGEFVMIPRLDVHLSAGNGHNNQVEIELAKENPQAFRTEWIRAQRLKPNKLAAMRAAGESMEPTIHDGDSLLVDTSQTNVIDGKVYALWYDGGERVKRLFRLPGGGLRIESDNSRFPALQLQPGELENVRIIGRVVHRSGTGGL